MRLYVVKTLPETVRQVHHPNLGLCMITRRHPSGAISVLTPKGERWWIDSLSVVRCNPYGEFHVAPESFIV